jgi:predicted AlkP superfamily pyrophosphatase or phosphodiesterase
MGYARSIFVLLGMWLAACVPAAPARSAAPARPASNVSLVMIDGLTEALLERYLALPIASDASSFLGNRFRPSTDSGAPDSQQVLRLTASSELPGLAAVNVASLLTGVAPSRHRVRTEDDIPSSNVPTIAE